MDLRAGKVPHKTALVLLYEGTGENDTHSQSADSIDSDAVLIEAVCTDLHFYSKTTQSTWQLHTIRPKDTISVICLDS